jgi:DNA-binding NarL/FixJ family response regulator
MVTAARHSGPDKLRTKSGTPERVLIVDDHPAVRAGLRRLLEQEFEIIAAVATADDALLIAERETLDVAVVDYQLGGHNGLWASRKLKRVPEPPAVLIYSAYTDGVLAASAVVAQADAIVSKGGLGSALCEAIRCVARGQQLLPPVPQWLGDVLRRRLSHEEQAIFGMLLAGIKPDEIAETLGVSEAALESSLWGMLRSLQAVRPGARGRYPSRRPRGGRPQPHAWRPPPL